MSEKELVKEIKEYSLSINGENYKETEDAVIRFFSKVLPLEFWDEYLKPIEVGIQGLQLTEKSYKKVCDNQRFYIWENSSQSAPLALKKAVADALLQLTSKQRAVIEKYFFENKSESETASELSVDQSSVNKIKIRALERIKLYFIENVIDLTSIEGKNICQKDIFDQIEDEYWKDQLSDDEFYHLWALAEVGGLKTGSL